MKSPNRPIRLSPHEPLPAQRGGLGNLSGILSRRSHAKAEALATAEASATTERSGRGQALGLMGVVAWSRRPEPALAEQLQ